MKPYVFRLRPGSDLRGGIDDFIKTHNIRAGVVVTCVGHLTEATIRMPDETTKEFKGTFEIISLVGTAEVGNSHMHISIADTEGRAWGGHLKFGTIVGTTAEVVIGELEGRNFKRMPDSETGFDELIVE